MPHSAAPRPGLGIGNPGPRSRSDLATRSIGLRGCTQFHRVRSFGGAQRAHPGRGAMARGVSAGPDFGYRGVRHLAAAAGEVFGALYRNADAKGDGEGAIAAAERLIALEPTREDRQRIALQLFARYKGCDARSEEHTSEL